MRNKALILVLVGIFFLSSFAVLAYNLPVSTYSNNMYPDGSAAGYYYGNLTIHPDGSITGTGSQPLPAQASNGVISLAGNVNGTINDQLNGSTINGNGYTVNGGLSSAVIAGNVTGITIEDLSIVNITQSSDGIHLYHVYNAVVNNVLFNNTNDAAVTLAWLYYSGNVTIKDSKFQLGSISSSSYGIDAEYDSEVNVSYNNFTGTIGYPQSFVYSYVVGLLNAWGNNINSTSSSPDGFDFEDGGNAVFSGNYINNTDDAINVNGGQFITSMNNYISNSSSSGYDIYYVSNFTSFNDTDIFSVNPLYLEYMGSAYVNGDNFSNTSSGAIFEYSNYLEITNSKFTTNNANELIDAEYGIAINLTNDRFILGSTSGAEAVYATDISGQVNLANDYISAPDGYGLYVDYSPQFSVLNSYFNTSYGIYVDYDYAIPHATISGNTFVGSTIQDATYIDAYDLYNFNFNNNVVHSSDSSTVNSYGIQAIVGGLSSNITLAGNTIINDKNPIYIDGTSYTASNAMIQNNTIVNSSVAIYVYAYSNSAVTGNKIINVSGTGISFDAYYSPSVLVSDNLVENTPGFGGMGNGISVENVYGGTNIISHNTVINPSSTGYDISVNYTYPAIIDSNTVIGGAYGIYAYYNSPVELFGNTVNNTDYGIYSYLNSNFSYYSNTVNNANYSFYSYEDYGGSVFANTFSDSQANNPQLYFLDVGDYTAITFYHNNFLNSTTNSTTYNGIYSASGPVFMNELLPVGGNYWSNYTGTGTDGIGNTPMNVTGTIQDLYPLTSMWVVPTVTFIETGLASGTQWSAMLGSSMKTSTGNTIVFGDNNGQYANVAYEISSVAGYTASVSSGSLYLKDASSTVTITYTPIPAAQYSVTFSESGLPTSTPWSVTLNGTTKTASTGSITFSEPNGTYSYALASVNGYHLTSSSGTVIVNGGSQTVSVAFLPNTNTSTYTISLVETGLPAGDYWNVTFNGQNYSTNGTVLEIQAYAGNYSVNISGPVGYTVSPQFTNITVDSSNVTLYVHFSAQKAVPAAVSGTAKVLEGLGIGVLITSVIGIMGSFFITGKFPWDLIFKK